MFQCGPGVELAPALHSTCRSALSAASNAQSLTGGWLVSSAIVFAMASITSSTSPVSTLSDAALAGYSAKKSSGRAKTGIGFAPVCRVVALLHARRLQGAGVGARQNGKLHRVTIYRELTHSDQTIKAEHVGTDPRRKNRCPRAFVVTGRGYAAGEDAISVSAAVSDSSHLR